MDQTPLYKMPTLETTPANIAFWAQASFFIVMFVQDMVDLRELTLSSDMEYGFMAAAAVAAAALLFRVPYSRVIAVFAVPLVMATLEGEPGYLIFGLIFFAPLVYMPAMAFEEFDQRPFFGRWTKKGWGTVLLTFFLLFTITDLALPSIAADGELSDDGELDEDYGQEMFADCEASDDCMFGEVEDEGEVIVIWKASSTEQNIAYLGIAMLLLSLITLVTTCLGWINFEVVTPTVSGVVLIGAVWIDTYLWATVTEIGISLDDSWILPVSGVVLMTIHGLFTESSSISEE